jgi:hypothetical protein
MLHGFFGSPAYHFENLFLRMENEMSRFDSKTAEANSEPPQGNGSRTLRLPRMTEDSDVILYCITANDVDQFCEDYEQALLTDEEMQQLFCILHEDSRLFETLYDAVDDVGDGALRCDLASRVTMHADALV